MKYTDLEFPRDILGYDARKYEKIRDDIEKSTLDAGLKEDAIHYSFCMQNLHLNFQSKLEGMLEIHNKNGVLPMAFYFEPKSRSFPINRDAQGNKLSEDGLRTFNAHFVHHADLYPMKTLPITWNELLVQYEMSAEYALQSGKLEQWVSNIGGCFEASAGAMSEWHLRDQQIEELRQEKKIAKAADTEQMVILADELIPPEIKAELNFAEDYLVELKKVVKLHGQQEATDKDILEMITKILFLDTKPQEQISEGNKIKEKEKPEEKVSEQENREQLSWQAKLEKEVKPKPREEEAKPKSTEEQKLKRTVAKRRPPV